MDKSTIQRARQADLAEYLLSVGVPLIKNGSRYRHKEHVSLTFTGNAYYWNSRQEHGNAIDYLVRHMDMSFAEAVSALIEIPTADLTAADAEQKEFELDRASLSNNQDKVRKYLKNVRAIGYDVIYYLTENRLLFQEKQTNNAIFPMYDENNTCVGAEVHGLVPDKRFKGIKNGSKYGYGFNVRFSDDNTYDYALFFESAIDLLSFIDYTFKHEKKSLNRCILISMAGLKLNVVKHCIKAFCGDMKVVLCVDNSESGQMFKDTVKNAKISYIDRSPASNFKDWNEQISASRYKKVIDRVIERHSLPHINTNFQERGVNQLDRPK